MIKAQEQLIRKVTTIGNGAHIFAPKDWLGEEVFIIRTPQKSLKEKILSVLDPYLEYIEGAYLYGSQSRGETTKDSDIDLLLITTKKLKIKKSGYEIISLQKNEISKAIKIEPIIVYSALSEAKPIINVKLLEELKDKYKPKLADFKEFIEDTKRILSINKEFLELDKEEGELSESESVPYSLILRLRGMFIINNLLLKKIYSNKKFHSWINKNVQNIDYSTIYEVYKAVKNNSKAKKVKIKDLVALHDFLKKETKKLENKIHDKKKKTTKKRN